MKRFCQLWIISMLFASLHVWANGTTIGYVKTVNGNAQIISGSSTIPAKAGAPLRTGDRILTGSDGSLGLTLKDNTVMSIGPDTNISVDEYAFDPPREKLQLAANLSSGTLHFVSGVIAKLKPEAVAIRTPTGTIGVRGTRFVVKVAPSN